MNEYMLEFWCYIFSVKYYITFTHKTNHKNHLIEKILRRKASQNILSDKSEKIDFYSDNELWNKVCHAKGKTPPAKAFEYKASIEDFCEIGFCKVRFSQFDTWNAFHMGEKIYKIFYIYIYMQTRHS